MARKAMFSLFMLISLILASMSALAADGIDILQTDLALSGSTGILAGVLDVNNTGNTTLNITFGASVLTGPGGNLLVTLPSDLKNRAPGSSTPVIMQVDINTAVVGTYSGTVTATGGTASDTASLEVTVLQNGEGLERMDGGIISLTGDAGQTVSGSFDLENKRNDAIAATLDGDIGFAADFLAETRNIPAFSTATIDFTITIPPGTAPGVYDGAIAVSWNPTITIPIQVTVSSTKAISVPGSVSASVDLTAKTTASFTIVNTGNTDVEDLTISFNPANFTDDDGDQLSINISQTSDIDLPIGGSKLITLTIGAPANFDPALVQGDVVISNVDVSATTRLSVNVENILRITDVEVNSEGSDRRIKPGELFEIEVEVENIARDIDLEDVEITVYFLDGTRRLDDDDGDDLEEDVELNRLSAGKDDDVTFTFRMPYDVDDRDRFVVVVEVEAVNEDDSSQKFFAEDRTEDIEVDREENEVEIFIARLESGILSCNRFTNLEVGLRDVGEEEEDVFLEIANTALGISFTDSFELSEDEDDNNFEIIRRFPIDATGAREGIYQIQIRALYNNRRDLATAELPLTVNRCDEGEDHDGRVSPPSEEEQRRETIAVQFGSGRDTFVPRISGLFTAKKVDMGTSSWLIVLLVLAILIVASVFGWGAKKYWWNERKR